VASLRKKPADDAVAAADAVAPEVAVNELPEDDASLALRKQIDGANRSEQIQRERQQAAMLAHAANERRMSWLQSTPGAKENAQALGRIHYDALNSGLVDTSPEYFSYLEQRLAELQQPTTAATHLAQEMQMRAAQDRAAPPPPAEPKRSPVYSAPVSRDVPSIGSGRRQSNSRITLTPQEVEMARISGVSLDTYAREKLRLAQMRADGTYADQERGQ
jgi:hypothetical protein